MFQGLNGSPAKAGEEYWQPKRGETLRGVQDAVCYLLIRIDDLTIGVKKGQGAPRDRPVEGYIGVNLSTQCGETMFHHVATERQGARTLGF